MAFTVNKNWRHHMRSLLFSWVNWAWGKPEFWAAIAAAKLWADKATAEPLADEAAVEHRAVDPAATSWSSLIPRLAYSSNKTGYSKHVFRFPYVSAFFTMGQRLANTPPLLFILDKFSEGPTKWGAQSHSQDFRCNTGSVDLQEWLYP